MDSDTDNQQDGPNTPDWIKDLRRKAEAYDKDFAPLQRKVALIDAGVDMSNPVTALFAEAYKGELTPEAIKAEAAKYGLVPAPAQGGDQQAQPGQQQAAPQLSPEQQAILAQADQIRQAAGQVPQSLIPASPEQILQQQADAYDRINQAAQGGLNPTPTVPDWQTASSPEEMLRLYAAAVPGGIVDPDEG